MSLFLLFGLSVFSESFGDLVEFSKSRGLSSLINFSELSLLFLVSLLDLSSLSESDEITILIDFDGFSEPSFLFDFE